MDNKYVLLAFVVCLSLLAIFLPLAMAPNTPGPNYKNVTVWTHVNITNSRPEILNVTVYDTSNASRRNITVNAGLMKNITCNVTVRDWNGYSDVSHVNATLWHATTSTFDSPDDNNSHYTNSNCSDSGNGDGFFVNYLCYFEVIYYANNGTWVCNASVMDNQSTTDYGNGTTIFYPVYALNITDGIEYGSLAVEDLSGNATANITNIGNMAINITVEGYGGRKGDGLAMNCSLWGNITVDNERFATQEVDWSSKISLSSSPQMLPDLTIMKQIDSEVKINTTYWQLYVDSTNGPGGNCTGYVIFTAIAP